MTYDTCPHIQDVYVLGDSRVHMDHLGRVLAAKFRQRFNGVDVDDSPAPSAPARSRVARWLARLGR